MVNLDVDPKSLANWLQVSINQRSRTLTKLIAEYGPNDVMPQRLQLEINEIRAAQSKCLEAAAKAPLKK